MAPWIEDALYRLVINVFFKLFGSQVEALIPVAAHRFARFIASLMGDFGKESEGNWLADIDDAKGPFLKLWVALKLLKAPLRNVVEICRDDPRVVRRVIGVWFGDNAWGISLLALAATILRVFSWLPSRYQGLIAVCLPLVVAAVFCLGMSRRAVGRAYGRRTYGMQRVIGGVPVLLVAGWVVLLSTLPGARLGLQFGRNDAPLPPTTIVRLHAHPMVVFQVAKAPEAQGATDATSVILAGRLTTSADVDAELPRLVESKIDDGTIGAVASSGAAPLGVVELIPVNDTSAWVRAFVAPIRYVELPPMEVTAEASRVAETVMVPAVDQPLGLSTPEVAAVLQGPLAPRNVRVVR